MLNRGHFRADFLALNVLHISQHLVLAKIAMREVIHNFRRTVECRQRNQIMEHASLTSDVCLERSQTCIRLLTKLVIVKLSRHQAIIIRVRPFLDKSLRNPVFAHLLAQVQRPVKAWAVIVSQLRIWNDFLDPVHHPGNFRYIRRCRFDPKQISAAIGQACNAILNHTVLAGIRLEFVETIRQTHRLLQRPVQLNSNFPIFQRVDIRYGLGLQPFCIFRRMVTGFPAHWDLLRQPSAKAIGARDNYAIIHTQLFKGHANGAQLLNKVFSWNRYLAILMATLFCIRHLIFNLDAARPGLDHFLGKQIGRMHIAKPSINIRDDRSDIRLVIIDLLNDRLTLSPLSIFQCRE